VSRPEPKLGPLASAARALEEALAEVEAVVADARAPKLDSERRIDEAARRLQSLSDLEQRFQGPLAALGEAMGAVLERQRLAGEALATRVRELQERRGVLAELYRRYEALGREAAGLNGGLREAKDVDLETLGERLRGLADAAGALASDAHDRGFPTFGQDAHGLRQQLLAMRNKLALLPARAEGRGLPS
jgi:chromosome segregation ATPase